MRKAVFSNQQIIGRIMKQRPGLPTALACRNCGLSAASCSQLKANYRILKVS
ncbi:MAG: hypothetical protein SNJ79_14165 [Sphingomonadaceae bacterium]